jgi:hypothetical protein
MALTYKIVVTPVGITVINAVFSDSDKMLSIPMEPANTDYQAYLEWVDEGNTAEEAD